MSVMLYLNEEAETQNTTNVWQSKLGGSKDLGTEEGNYMIWASAEYSGSATTKVSSIEVLLDGVEVALEQYTPPIVNQVRVFNSMGLVHLTGGSHTLELLFRSESTPNTTRCRRARILIMKH